MDFLTLAQTRYTTKKYNPNLVIQPEKIEALKRILQLSPSSINSQPWSFTIISNKDIKNELASYSFFNEQKVKDASHLVVFQVIHDLEKFEAQIQKNLPEGAVGYYQQFLKIKSETEIQAWLAHQVYLSIGFFLGACATMEIDATPMEGIQPEEYDKILNKTGYTTLVAVAIGYRDESDSNQPDLKPKSRLDLDQVVQTIG